MTEPSSTGALVVLSGPMKGTRYEIEDLIDDVLIGSDADCRFCLDVPGVSPVHARLWIDLEGARLYDTRSPHGLYLNDEKVVSETAIKNGDVIWLGPPGDPGSTMLLCRFSALGPPSVEASAPPAIVESPRNAEAPDRITFAPEPMPEPEPTLDNDDLVLEPEVPRAPASTFERSAEPPRTIDGGAPDAVDLLEEVGEPLDLSPVAPASPGGAVASEPLTLEEVVEPVSTPPTSEPAPVLVEDFFVAEDAVDAVVPEPAGLKHPAGSVEDLFVDEPPRRDPAPPGVFDFSEFLSAPTPPAPEHVEPSFSDTVMDVPQDAALELAATAPEISLPVEPPTPRVAPPPEAPAAPEARVEERPPSPAPPAMPERPAQTQRPAPGPRPPRPKVAPARPAWLPAAGIGALILVAAGAWLYRQQTAPTLVALQPQKAQAGDVLTLQGAHLPSSTGDVSVLFGERAVAPRSASADGVQVVVPELLAGEESDKKIPVRLRVSDRTVGPLELDVFVAAKVSAIQPSLALPGDEVVIKGTRLSNRATVLFAGRTAEIVSATPTELRVKVPALDGAPGTDVPVAVTLGRHTADALRIVLGHPPLVTGVEPASATFGDVIKIKGRGFEAVPAANLVRVSKAPSLVVSASDTELSVVMPRVSAGTGLAVEVQSVGGKNIATARVDVLPLSEPVDLRFFAEPADAADRALVSTPLGPIFQLAGTSERSAAERAIAAARTLSAVAATLKASPTLDVEVRGLEERPYLGLTGQSSPLLDVTAEDAAAVGVTRGRLARWWGALLHDVIRLMARGQAPDQVAAVAPAEGRVLGEAFAAASRNRPAAISRALADDPRRRAGFRALALRVPAGVPGPRGGETGVVALRLAGSWSGSEVERSGARRSISVDFRGSAGTYSLLGGGAASMSLGLEGLRQEGATVRFAVPLRGRRDYVGRWDGKRLSGQISSGGTSRGDIGTFELFPQTRP